MDDSCSIWQMNQETALHALSVTEDGLTGEEAARRKKLYGANVLKEKKKIPVWRIFLGQFFNFTVGILIVAAVISAFLDDEGSALVILIVLVLNAIMGTVQTVRAEHSLEALRKLSAPVVKVLRDEDAVVLPAAELTPGDVVLLEAGDAVCADGRILECASLRVSESMLTGESLPVEKQEEALAGAVALGDRTNMVFSGSFVTHGRGRFLVTAVGMDTEIGKIASMMESTKERKTPLQMGLDRFGVGLSYGVLAICAVIIAVCVLLRGENWLTALLFSVAVAVAAIPESLAPIVTIVLGFGSRKMAQEHAIVRKLQAVEGLGSVSVICSDKTGTLTCNRMTVQQVYLDGKIQAVESVDFSCGSGETLLRYALLCNDAEVNEEGEVGDPTEAALVRLAEEHGLQEWEMREQYPREGEIPFDSQRMMMSTAHRFQGSLVMVTKGAPDVLLDCSRVTEDEETEIMKANRYFAERGMRVLAFAWKLVDQEEITADDEAEMHFLGMVAMQDPPRSESASAVAQCIQAGIRPVMITGDHRITAATIARELGILRPGDQVLDGEELDELTDEALRELAPRVSVYARVSPEHKIRIVRAWQEHGELVAMTGDGVNDAPALKQADIGVAMGVTGTEVAKNAAGMVLADDYFATIVKAVQNGRNVYANIRGAVQFLLSGNAAAILVVLYASLGGFPLPFAAVQLLFINLLCDSLTAIALGMEPHRAEVMAEKPRPKDEGILTRGVLISVVSESVVIALAVIAAFHLGLAVGGAAEGRTMAVAGLCMGRLFHGLNCKAAIPVLFTCRMWNNRWLLGAIGVGLAMLAAVLTIPVLSSMLEAVALSVGLYAASVALAVASLVAAQVIKVLRTKRIKY